MDSITTGLRILDGETTLVQKSDGTLVELEDLGGGGGGNVDLTNYYTKGETDIRLAFKQHLLDNTAVSGSNEGIIRIWEISSERFIRCFHQKH